MTEIGNRLMMAAGLVEPCGVLADIGTDHAYLPAYLLLNNTVKKALACDLRKGPLCNAEKTAEICHLQGRIELRLSDGFDGIAENEADTFTVCGMGGTLIAEIFERTPWLKNPRYLFVIQPQSHSNDVRKYFFENGFEILKETACFDDSRAYNAMAVRYTGVKRDYDIFDIYFGTLAEKEDAASRQIASRTLEYIRTRQRMETSYGDPELAAEFAAAALKAEELLK